MVNTRTLIMAALMSLSVTAQADNAQSQAAQLPQIESMKQLPVNGLVMIMSQGKPIFVTPGGRFAITGTLRDMWTGKVIDTLEGVDSMSRVPISKVEQAEKDLGILQHGEGRTVYAFVDPHCTYCQKLFEHASTDSSVNYRFVITPMLGQRSNQDSVTLWCASDREAATTAMLSHQIGQLEQTDDCDKSALVKNLTFAKILGVTGVPFLIRDDGLTSRGLPTDLKAWTNEG